MQVWKEIVNFITSEQNEQIIKILVKIGIIFAILIGIKIVTKSGNYFIHKLFQQQEKNKIKMSKQKALTMEKLLQNIFKYVIGFVGITMLLSQVGVDVGLLVTTAGIGGIAFAFGAQALIADILTGAFILFEDQFCVGDWVTIGDITGTVEEMGIRTTRIRGYKGELYILTNGQIDKVTNFSRGDSLAIVDMGVSYDTDIKKASQVMQKAATEYFNQSEDVIEEPSVIGVVNLGESDIVIRLIAKTVPMGHYQVERDLRQAMKEAFDGNGIEIPFPHRVIINQAK